MTAKMRSDNLSHVSHVLSSSHLCRLNGIMFVSRVHFVQAPTNIWQKVICNRIKRSCTNSRTL